MRNTGRKSISKFISLFMAGLLIITIVFSNINTASADDSDGIKGTIKVVLNIASEKIDKYIKAFRNKYPGVDVKYVCLSDYENDIKNMVDAGDYGDVLFVPSYLSSDLYSEYFDEFGTVTELNSKYSFIQQGKINDNIVYGIPSSAYLNGIIYNKRVFDEAGITKLPQTADEFMEALKMIKMRTNAIPFYTNCADSWTLKTWTLFPYIEMTGNSAYMNNDFLDELNPFISGTNQYKVYDLLYQMVSEGYTEKDHSQTNWQHSKEMLNCGDIACMAIGSWALLQCKEAGNSGDDVRFMPFPNNVNGKQYVTLSTDYSYGINIHSQNKEAAYAFVRFMIDESGYAVDNDDISIVPQDPTPAAYGDMSNVSILTSDPYTAQSYEKKKKFDEKMDISSPDIAERVIKSAAGETQETFDDIMTDCNTKWESARTPEMKAQAQKKSQSVGLKIPDNYEVSLSDAEKQYINENNTVRVAYVKSVVPFMYEENGKFKGVSSELLQIIGDRSGVKFQYVAYDNTQEAIQAVKDGKVDMIAGMVKNDEYSNDIKFSKDYIDGMYVLIKNKNFDSNDVTNNTKAVVNGETSYNIGNTKNTNTVSSFQECIEAVDDMSATYTIMNYYTASCYTQNGKYNNISVSPLNSDAVICMGFSNNIDSRLVSICNKYIYSIPDSNIQMIAVQNVNDNAKMTTGDFIKENIVFILVVVTIILVVILLLVLIVLKEKVKNSRKDELRIQMHDVLYGLANQYLYEYLYKDNTIVFDKKFEKTFGFSGSVSLDSYKEGKAINRIKDIFIKNFLECRDKGLETSQTFKIEYDGQKCWYKMEQSQIEENGKPVQIYGRVLDVQKEMQEVEHFQNKAEHDELTELYNREGFNRRYLELRGDEESYYTVAILDFDDFKKVNDTLGHAGGDEALKFLADTIRKAVNGDGIAARYGGDEFLIFLSEVDKTEVKDIFKRLVNAMNTDFTYEGKTITLSISLGAICKKGFPDKELILKKANKLLYDVKRVGKNGYNVDYVDE